VGLNIFKFLEDGDTIALRTQVINMSSYDAWVNANVSFYKSYSDNTTDYIGSKATNASGWAVHESHIYDSSSGLYAFIAKASYAKIVAVNYITLTVAAETRLLLDVEKDNATSYMQTVNGTQPFCTTTYYGYQPATNTTTLTVSPQSTDTATPTKTPEELQHEAEDSEWYRTEHEFTLWFPFYRLHLFYVYEGEDQVDFGLSIIPGANIVFIYDSFQTLIAEVLNDIARDVLKAWLIGEACVFIGMHAGIWAFLAALAISIGTKAYLLSQSWDSKQKLGTILVATLISTLISISLGLHKFFSSSLIAMASSALGILKAAFSFLYKFVMVPINIFLLFNIHNRIMELEGS
jgi:hypothetical protein